MRPLFALLLLSICLPSQQAAADDTFSVTGGLILAGGPAGRQVAELPPGLVPLSVQGEKNGQGLSVLGQLFVEHRDNAPASGDALTPSGTPVLLRYGRTTPGGDLRLLLSAPAPPMPLPGLPGPLSVTLPARRFELSERVIDLPLPSSGTGRTQHRVQVSLDQDLPETLRIDPGTCKATRFLAGGIFDPLQDATQIMLTKDTARLALGVEQGPPGEDCMARLIDDQGETPLRIRGTLPGGSTVLLVDRSFSMERSLLGAGPASFGENRADATRRALMLLLATLTVLPDGSTGNWAVLPFTDGVAPEQAAPLQGLAPISVLGNPDRPDGLRIKGFAGGQADFFDPGGPTDLLKVLPEGLFRLGLSDGQQERRLWLWTDGQIDAAGNPAELADYEAQVPALARLSASLHVFGLGSLLPDPLLFELMGRANGRTEAPFSPVRGGLVFPHHQIDLSETLVSAVSREVMHGRGAGSSVRGQVQGGTSPGATPLSIQFTLPGTTTRNDPWVLFLAAWEHPEASMDLDVTVNDTPSRPRCLHTATAEVCAVAGLGAVWKAALHGMRGGGPEPALLRAFVASSGPSGDVSMVPSFGRSVYHTGDKVQVTVRLGEQGLPLRLAKVTAQVSMPGGAASTLVTRAPLSRDAVLGLQRDDGDLSPGQAVAELLDPSALPADTTMSLVLTDDGQGADGDAADGVYTGEFVAPLPGRYGVDLRVEHDGIVTQPGVIEEHIGTTVVTGLSAVPGSITTAPLSGVGRLQVTLVPQDRSGNLLGPGQPDALCFLQGQRVLSARVTDLLDGSYRAEVYGIMAQVALEVRTPGGQITLLSAAEIPQVPGLGAGCGVVQRTVPGGTGTGVLLFSVLLLVLLARRRWRPCAEDEDRPVKSPFSSADRRLS